MAWQDDFQPDQGSTGNAVPAWQSDFQPEPVAAAPAVVPSKVANFSGMGAEPPTAAPSGPESVEPTFAATDLAPGDASPDAAARMRDASQPLNPADVASVKAAQMAALNEKIAAVSQALGGAKFDPATGDNSVSHRFNMGMMAQPGDRLKYLKANLPAGSDVKNINVPGMGTITVFKPPGSDSYHPIRGSNDTAGGFGDLLSGVPAVATQAAIAGATGGEGNLAEALAARLPAFVPARSLAARMLMQGAGGAGERGTELVVNKARGYDSQPLGSDVADAARSGAAADVGELGGTMASYIGRAGSDLKNGGALAPGPFNLNDTGASRITSQKALQKINPELPPMNISNLDNVMLERKAALLGALNSNLRNQTEKQNSGIADTLSKMAGSANAASPQGIADAPMTVAGNQYPGMSSIVGDMKTAAAAPVAGIPTTEMKQGGQSLADIYQNAIKPVAVDRPNAKYGKVIDKMSNAPDQPNGVMPLDLSATHAAIDKEAKPIYGQGVPAQVEKPVMGAGGLGEPVQIGSTTETVPTDRRTGGGISPQIASTVEDLRALNPQNGVGPMTERTASPYEAVKPIRTVLSEKSVYNPLAPGADREASSQAGRIVDSLSNAIDTAAGRISDAAKASRTFAGEILDNPKAIAARETPYPEENMAHADPANASFLANTQRLAGATGQSDLYKTFQDALHTSLVRQPEKIDPFLASGRENPGAMTRLATPERQEALGQFSKNTKDLQGSLPVKMLNEPSFTARGGVPFKGSVPADPAALTDLVAKSGGIESPIAQNIRSGMFKSIVENGMKADNRPDAGKIAANIRGLLADGRAKAVLTPEEMTNLNHLMNYADGVAASSGNDMGAALAGSRTVQEATNPFNPKGVFKSLGKIFENRFQNHTWLSEHGRDFLTQEGAPAGYLPRAMALGGAEEGLNQHRLNQQEPTIGGR